MPENRPEVLAPCGQFESVVAAIRTGADAVYLGQKSFSARASAHNFSADELAETVSYCHARGVKVYQTLNTLVFEDELHAVEDCIETACRCGIDGLIVQDMGVLQLVKKCAPDMRLHASTQMAIQSPAGAQLLEQLGVRRAVLARELSLAEIREISSATSLELEVFVHGALCMCVSGQCYLSAMIGSRSGNRGQCAQPCRLPFSSDPSVPATGENAPRDLSLKDLCALDSLHALAEAGVASLKIEGRMKRPEYVAAAVNAVQKTLSGQPADVESLRAVFSRSGFTNGYLEGNPSPAMFGTRLKEDVTAAAGVLGSLKSLYRAEYPRIPIRIHAVLTETACTLTMTDADGNRAEETIDLPDSENLPTENRSTDEDVSKSSSSSASNIHEGKGASQDSLRPFAAVFDPREGRISKALSKLGTTPFYAETIEIDLQGGGNPPVSAINALRRNCCDRLLALRGQIQPFPFHKAAVISAPQRPRLSNRPQLWGRFRLAEQLSSAAARPLSRIILPADEILRHYDRLTPYQDKLAAELPAALFGREGQVKRDLVKLQQGGIQSVMAQNPAHILLAREAGLTACGDFRLNVTNALALRQYAALGLRGCTLSIECRLGQAERLCGLEFPTPGGVIPAGLVVYGRLPLMLCRNCPIKNHRSCPGPGLGCSGALTDRMGVKFPVVCDGTASEILNSEPIWLADRMEEFSAFDFATLYFTNESPDTCATVVESYLTCSGKPDHYTRGLYYRGVR